jgi:hypothetical protein
MAITVLNPAGFQMLSEHSGNPFLDAMTDLQDVFNTVMTYQRAKPYIDKYSDTSLSDLKDKIKTYLPEAVNDDGSINFAKVEELANQGNKIAETVIGVKNHRESFANASVGEKLATLLDPKNAEAVAPILSGEHITKTALVLKNTQAVEDAIKKAGFPKDLETVLLLNKEKIAGDPRYLSLFLNYFTQQPKQENNNPDINLSDNNNNDDDNDNIINFDTTFKPKIKSMQDIFPQAPQLQTDGTPRVASNNTPNTKQKFKQKPKKKTAIPKILGNVSDTPILPPQKGYDNEITHILSPKIIE